MCSRYSLTSPPEAVRSYFKCGGDEVFPPRYNISPTDPVHIVRIGHTGLRELCLVRWGLIPSWVKDPREFSTLFNARSESVAEKPSFRGPFRQHRCLVPANGFYEWTGKAGAKQPYLVRRRDQGLFAFAGLWDSWLGADGSEIETMTILTVPANQDVARIHERMPVILDPKDYVAWLEADSRAAPALKELLRPAPEGQLELVAVSRRVNNPQSDGPELQEPADGERMGGN